jgi:hypothetical protein
MLDEVLREPDGAIVSTPETTRLSICRGKEGRSGGQRRRKTQIDEQETDNNVCRQHETSEHDRLG